MEDYCLDINETISVVVPVYNSEPVIKELYQRLASVLENCTKNYEIIFVDDASHDDSWQVIKSLKESNNNKVKGVRLSKNYGQHNATLCGIFHSNADYIITIDDDLEYQPEEIPQMLKKMKATHCDLVYAIPKNKKNGFIRRVLTFVFRKLQRASKKDYIRGSSFRLIKGNIARQLINNKQHFSFIDEFLRWYTDKIESIEITVKNSSLSSRYEVKGLMKITKSLIYLSSTIPLKMVTYTGFFIMIFNFLAALIIIYRRFVLIIDVKGYTSIIVTILFSFGLLVFALGIIAEYLGQILKMNYNKPAYFESEVI